MAKDNESEARSRLMQIINAKKTGGAVPTPPAKPGASAPGPAKKPGQKAAPKVTLSKPTLQIRGRALIVEPNQRIGLTLQNTLKSLRLNSEVTASGADCLAKVGAARYDFVFVEKQLPDIGGFNLCSKIRALPNGRDVFIIITGEGNEQGMKDQALMVDANEYLQKPVNTGELGTIVDEHMHNRGGEGDAAGEGA